MKTFKQIQEECLTELSNQKLGQYVVRATKQSTTQAFKAGMHHAETGKFRQADDKKLRKRTQGIERATNKLVSRIQSEENLQELSRRTLGSYIIRSHGEIENDAYDLGVKHGKKPYKSGEKANRKELNRFNGFHTAVEKLVKKTTNEAVEDEN